MILVNVLSEQLLGGFNRELFSMKRSNLSLIFTNYIQRKTLKLKRLGASAFCVYSQEILDWTHLFTSWYVSFKNGA